ncbi:transmembrane protein 255A isoform X3 [Poecile atricapillus]|uniref:transmembrane protein 255A isoform X3 n=2 Tax=Poecile atricapillus TaxID=48891 RepID=UPI00273983C6|nr:transmembrane protein 255A isoform X3 [Poecile atricapillus]
MRQSLTQQRPAGVALPDSVGSFNRRKRNSLYVTVTLLIVSVLILTVGLAATTRTQNVTVGGYYPGVILGFGSFLGIIGSNLIENKRQMDLRPLYAGRCQYYSKSTTPPEAVCHPQRRAPCTPKIKTNTCFCCDLYNCGSRVEISGGYYEYIDVSSCQDIIHLYHLLWSATILNIVGLFLGIITAAILGGFKDMTPSLPTLNCTVENAHPSVTYYSRPQVTSYNSYYHSTPHLPPYSAYDFQALLSPCSIPACFQPPLLLASLMTPSPCHHHPAICGPLMHHLVTHRPISHLLKSHHLTHHKECGKEEKKKIDIKISVNILYLYFTVGGSRRIQKIIANKNIRLDCPFL